MEGTGSIAAGMTNVAWSVVDGLNAGHVVVAFVVGRPTTACLVDRLTTARVMSRICAVT